MGPAGETSGEARAALDRPVGRPAKAWFGTAIDGLNGAGSVLIGAIMLLICADVVARNAFNRPIHGVAELVALSIVAIVFLQLASTLRHGRMSRAELFIDDFRQRHPFAGGLLQASFDLAGVLVCAVLVWATWPKFAAAWTGAEFVGVQGQFTAPTWPVRLVVLIGGSLTAIQYGVHVVRNVRGAWASRALRDECR